MKSFWILVLPVILFFSLSGCESQEALEPIKHPRFGVALVQEVSEKGVQFGANVFEIGSQEVIEYGFVYSKNNINPKTTMDDMVSVKGRPGDYFELFANHSLQVGQKYYVAAFMKTEDLVIYSKSEEFVSQGSDGFLITSVEWPEKIYKFQSLTIKGQRLSRSLSNYQVKIDQYNVSFSLLDSNTLIVDLPSQLLTETTGKEKEVELNLQVAGKSFTQKKIVTFQEPVFEKLPLQLINFDQEVVIKGDFLDLGEIGLKYNSILRSSLSISNKNEFRFFPYKDYVMGEHDVLDPDVIVTVRGVEYNLGKVFKIKPTQLLDSEIVFKNNRFVLRGSNFSTRSGPEDNQFIGETGERLNFVVEKAYPDSLIINLQSMEYSGRDFSFQVKNFGSLSNSVKVKVEIPGIRLKSSGLKHYIEDIRGIIQQGDFGYAITSKYIFQYDFSSLPIQIQQISTLPSYSSIYGHSIISATESYFVVGGGISIDRSSSPVYLYSIENKQWENLSLLPTSNSSFSRIYEVNDGIVFEGGITYSENSSERIDNNERWLYSIREKKWKQLASTQTIGSSTLFSLGQQHFGIFYNEMNGNRELYQKTGMEDSWQFVKKVDVSLGGIIQDNPMVIDNKVYFSSIYHPIVEFDLMTKNFRNIGNMSAEPHNYPMFRKGKSLWFIFGNSIYDFRPDLL